jgi:hypothetical protein
VRPFRKKPRLTSQLLPKKLAERPAVSEEAEEDVVAEEVEMEKITIADRTPNNQKTPRDHIT